MIRRVCAAAILVLAAASPGTSLAKGLTPFAQETGRWLEASAIAADAGLVWPADPRDPKSVNSTLYAGSPGPILFFLESFRLTGNRRDLSEARRGADALLASIARDAGTGLYDGLAGTGFTLGEVYLVTHEEKYRRGALQCVARLSREAKHAGKGVEWGGGNDIISGSAGTGLFLLWADKALEAPGARALASEAGERLIEVAERPGEGRLRWTMGAGDFPEMPNFSHGTAGVAYFLATLYRETRREEFLDAAIAGANYLISIADPRAEGCLIYHDDKHKDLFYLGWCHGPAGDARLFYRLYQVTNDPRWMEWVKKTAATMVALAASGAVVTPGRWDNISLCCGTTSQAAFFLDIYALTGEKRYLELARASTERLIAAATRDAAGARWVQAETRVKPDELAAQTGLMQGASGVGLWLLHMAEFERGGKRDAMVLPDNPFRY